jgi:hypothetical protein
MKKFFKFLLLPILTLVFLVSLSVGVLRPVEKSEEITLTYYTYSAEEQDYSWKEGEGKIYLVSGSVETECLVENYNISVTQGEVKIDAIKAEDGLSIKVLIAEGDPDAGVEPEYLVFNKIEEPVVSTYYIYTRYSDYLMAFLGLDKLEVLLGEHYFNSIFCSLAGSSLTTLVFLFTKFLKKPRKTKNNKKIKKERVAESIITKVPNPTKVNPTQGNHNLKF